MFERHHFTGRSLVAGAGLAFMSALGLAGRAREIQSLDGPWRFLQAEVAGAEQTAFDDTRWRWVTVPHDWSIAGPFSETNRTDGAGAFLPSGVAWYRKHFALPVSALGRCVSVEFDGVMQNSDIWINGMHLGHQPNGYVGFRYELPAAMLSFGSGTNNVLTVCADTSAQPASRWYAGAGIYRHARLVIAEPVRFAPDGLFVTTPQVSTNEATVRLETTITNATAQPGDINLQTSLLAADGTPERELETSLHLEAQTATVVTQQMQLPNPRLWSLTTPALYRAVTKLRSAGQIIDDQTKVFGIREARFDAETGFWLNGQNLKLKGVCLHPDGGAFGAAVPRSIWEERLRTLKSLGVNAIRTAHNPPDPEFLELCDQLGLLVMEKFLDCWTGGKNPDDDHPALAGQFLWTGIDYLGGSRHWPMTSQSSGLLDRTGAVRPLGRERQSGWSELPMVAIVRRISETEVIPTGPGDGAEEGHRQVLFADWTPGNLKAHDENVELYSNCHEVELFLNDHSLGKKMINPDAAPRNWRVPFQPGSLRAVGRDARGKVLATDELRTAGKAAAIRLTAETRTLSPDPDAVATVRAAITDAAGIVLPHATNVITFTLTGPGTLAAVDNGDNANVAPFQTNTCHACQGRCTAFIRASAASGWITLTAKVGGLASGSFLLRAATATDRSTRQ